MVLPTGWLSLKSPVGPEVLIRHVADESLDGVAIDYLVLGSRLGTETMRRRLFADHQREAIPQYFLIGTMPELWQRHCAELNNIDVGSDRAATVVQDTKAGFAIFARAALTQA